MYSRAQIDNTLVITICQILTTPSTLIVKSGQQSTFALWYEEHDGGSRHLLGPLYYEQINTNRMKH